MREKRSALRYSARFKLELKVNSKWSQSCEFYHIVSTRSNEVINNAVLWVIQTGPLTASCWEVTAQTVGMLLKVRSCKLHQKSTVCFINGPNASKVPNTYPGSSDRSNI